MSTRAKFVTEIIAIDPDTKGEVHLAVYKHENGGMLAIDSSFVTDVLDPEDDGLMGIPDPFSNIGEPEILYLEEE